MKRISFFLKLLLGNLLVMAIIVALVGVISYHFLDQRHRQQQLTHQQQLAGQFQHYFQRLWPLPPQQINADCKTLVPDQQMRLTVIAFDGLVLGDSQANPATMENHKTSSRPEVLSALQGRPSMDVRRSQTLAVEYRYLAQPVYSDGKVVAAVRLALPVTALAESDTFISNVLLAAAVAAIIAATLLGLLVNWLWYRPLREIGRLARETASGNYSYTPRFAASGELAELSSALNEMRRSLCSQLELIESQKEDLQTVVANLEEGVIGLNRQGQIVLMNDAAGKMFQGEADHVTIGQPIEKVVRHVEIVDLYRQAISRSGSAHGQAEILSNGQRTVVDVGAAVLSPKSKTISAIVVVRDITDIARTAAMKTEFVANASHELRTPLATIRAAVDTLIEIGPGDHQAFEKFMKMLDRHVQRLQDLTTDLLDLHRVEHGRMVLQREEITAESLTDWVKDHFKKAAAEKEVGLQVLSEPGLVMQSDRKLLELALQNLVHNAVKFTPAGGHVEVLLKRQDGAVAIIVSDTGCGIAAHDQHKVFERFFQSETSRSGDTRTRGTGLGLAIVKHAVDRLGGSVSLKSTLGKGTVVNILLPE